jgi:hypothetical protein
MRKKENEGSERKQEIRELISKRNDIELRAFKLREEWNALLDSYDEVNATLHFLLKPDENVLDHQIDWNALPVRVSHAFWELGARDGKRISTYRDLLSYSASHVLNLRGVGNGSMLALVEHLASLGLTLRA